MSPAESRAAAAASSPFRRGLAELEAVLAGPQASVFATWASQPLTRMVAAAIDDLALCPPPASGSEEVLVQYGMSQGLALARRLLSDPALVMAPRAAPAPEVTDDYSQPLDGE